MARKSRIYRPGAFYHVMLRGNNGHSIFLSTEDRCKLCLLIQEGIEKFHHRIHGFCFMQNHIHLILQTGEIHISKIMQHLAFRYTRYINRKNKRIGHLFQGRFKAILIDDSQYLLKLIRYVHRNPIRAGICADPKDYRWSSHSAYLGLETITWLHLNWILAKFDVHRNIAERKFDLYIKKEEENENNAQLKKGSYEGRFLGSDDFINNVLNESHQMKGPSSNTFILQELIEIICKNLNVPSSIIHSTGKDRKATQIKALLAFFVKKSSHITLKELADFVGRDISTISKLAKGIENKTQLLTKELIEKVNDDLKQLQIAILQA